MEKLKIILALIEAMAKIQTMERTLELIAANTANFFAGDGTTMGPVAHRLLYQTLKNQGDPNYRDPRNPLWFSQGFDFCVWHEVNGKFTRTWQIHTVEQAVEVAGTDGVIVTAYGEQK